jgi:Rrf2 family transcriptional regulator, cysteine metabolism repressor
MKLSTKGRYGVKAMFELALHHGGEPVSIKTIADKQNISEYYLEQLFGSLRKSGLIKSIRGAQGGYILSKLPEQITVADILNVLEGPIEISECITDDDAGCSRMNYCATRLLWMKISDSVNQVINSITLQDMINDYHEIQKVSKEKGENDNGTE